jgi:hypothetical protein
MHFIDFMTLIKVLGQLGKCIKQSRESNRGRRSISSSTSFQTKYGRRAL